MVRKLALAVSIALGTVNASAFALGLGDLNTKTGLNQSFAGDIELRSIDVRDLPFVKVRLADAAVFSRAGVDRPFYLTLLKFQPMMTSKGKPVIRVSSEFPIREPFLNFLIEVNWPKGRLLREYTVLLDPPTTTMRRPPKVESARAAPKTQPKGVAPPKATAKKPVRSQATPRPVAAQGPSEYAVKSNDTLWGIAKRLRPSGLSHTQTMMALFQSNPSAFLNNDINRLRRGVILRVPSRDEIAGLNYADAKRAYRAQQDQWLTRRDAKLQQAAKSASVAPGQQKAGQAADPAPAASPLASTDAAEVSKDELRIATARPDGQGEAGAGDDNAAAPAASDLKSRLIVARENAETSRQEAETLRSQMDDLQDRLRDMQRLISLKDEQLARLQDQMGTDDGPALPAEPEMAGDAAPTAEDAATAPVESEELSAEEALEQLVADAARAAREEAAVPADYRIQDVAPQIDPDKVVLESEAPVDASAFVEELLNTPEPPGDIESLVQMAPAPGGDYRIEDIPPQVDPDKIVEQAAAALEAQAPAGEGVTDERVAEAAVEPAVVEAPKAPVAVAVETPPQAEEPAKFALTPENLTAAIQDNIVPVAAGGIGLLGLFGWMMMRGRRKEAVAAAAPPAAAAVVAADAVEHEPVDQPAITDETLADLPDSSFLDDFSPSEINSLQDETGEVDPVSEADVYIAYGRYQQAEELLRQAMDRDPDRLALKHKLLEVHYATRNADAFTALAQEMADNGQDAADGVAWARAKDMGREIAPNNSLFDAGGIATAIGGVTALAEADQSELSIEDLDLTRLAGEYDAEQDPAEDLEAHSEVSITLDLEESSQLHEPGEQAVLPDSEESSAASDGVLSLDDLDSIEFEMPETEAADAGTDGGTGDGLDITDSLDLDSMMAEAQAAVDVDDSAMSLDSDFSAEELQAQLDELSDLSVLESKQKAAEVAEATEVADDVAGLMIEDDMVPEAVTDETIDLEDAFGAADGDTAEIDLADLEDSIDLDPGSDDDVETKLDLARAYVDMGDDEGARSILEEVMSEGSNTQKTNAEKLLSELG